MTILPKRPLLLALIALILSGHALLLPVFFVWTAFADYNTAITINGEPSQIGEHRLLLLASMVIWWCIAAAIAFGIWNRKRWTQTTIAVVFFVPYAVAAVASLIRLDFALFVICGLFAYSGWWYLYKKSAVVRFFDATT